MSVANEAESARLLAHEQLHFTITSFATDLHTDLLAASPTTTETACGTGAATAKAKAAFAKPQVGAQFKKALKHAEKKLGTTQNSYDDDTCHGLDETQQATWDGKF